MKSKTCRYEVKIWVQMDSVIVLLYNFSRLLSKNFQYAFHSEIHRMMQINKLYGNRSYVIQLFLLNIVSEKKTITTKHT